MVEFDQVSPQQSTTTSEAVQQSETPVECNLMQSGDEKENINDDCHMETRQNQDEHEGKPSDDDFSFQSEQKKILLIMF